MIRIEEMSVRLGMSLARKGGRAVKRADRKSELQVKGSP
jgi:hypothetical protein